MSIRMKNPATLAVLSLGLMVMFGSAATAYVLLDPERRVFDPPVLITVDERGLQAVDDPDHGVTAAVGAAMEWNTRDRTLVIAQAGPVSENLRVGDGLTTIHFDDPQKTCTQRLRCLAAAFVTYKNGDRATCGGLELNAISETDIVFKGTIPTWTSKDAQGGCMFQLYVESVVTHEVGHALGLGHSGDPRAIMWGAVRSCWNHSVERDDWAGIEALYGCELVRR